jgi:hypothetical protein
MRELMALQSVLVPLAVLLGAMMQPAAAAQAVLRAGAAQARITPSEPQPLAGYFRERLSTGVHDDLWAKALVLDDGAQRVALAVCDVIEVPAGVVERARRLVQQQTGIPPERVFISATHTHTAPGVEGRFAEWLPGRIAEAVAAAAKRMQPARIAHAAGSEPSLVFNRRFFMTDGTVGWNPGKRNPRIIRPAGPVDPRVSVITVDSETGAAIATLVHYALHLDTVGGTELSADYPYTLARLVSGARGGGVTMFMIGCAGNVNHLDVADARPQKGHGEAARIGTVLAGQAIRTMAGLEPVREPRLRSARTVLTLPAAPHTAEELAWSRAVAARWDGGENLPFLDIVKARRILDLESRNNAPCEAEVQALAAGEDIAWVGLPGEIFVELGLDIQKASPFRHTVVVSLANGSLGYFPNRKAWGEGNYEVVTARCAESSGERLAEAALRLLRELKR